MIVIRPAETRGHNNFGWLDTWHTFSFGEYHDPAHDQFRALRVINEDRVQPEQGFGIHGHKEMEILTWVLEGVLAHQDSMGNRSHLKPGAIQAMSAGTGVRHSEFNGSTTEPVHFLQIWLLPDTRDLAPRYQEADFADRDLRGRLHLVASGAGAGGAVLVHQDVQVYAARLERGETVAHAFKEGRHGYIQLARGAALLNESPLKAGDGAALSDEARVSLTASVPCEVLLFDLA